MFQMSKNIFQKKFKKFWKIFEHTLRTFSWQENNAFISRKRKSEQISEYATTNSSGWWTEIWDAFPANRARARRINYDIWLKIDVTENKNKIGIFDRKSAKF